MRILIIVIVALVLLYLAWKFIFNKPEEKQIEETIDDTPGNTFNNITEDYFVNGDPAHDKEVFRRGLECAKAFLYQQNTNTMANTVTALLGRGPHQCGSGFNCSVASSILGLTQENKTAIINYLINLQLDSNWKGFSNLAIGRKNMCSVILEQALKNKVPNVYNVVAGRG